MSADYKGRPVLIDIGSVLHSKFCAEAGCDIDRHEIHRTLVLKTLAGASKVSIKDFPGDAVFLKDHLETVESELGLIISKYGVHELLFWTRRIAPVDVQGRGRISVLLYRQVLDLAIKKYGKISNDFIATGRGLIPDYVKECGEIAELALSPRVTGVLSDCYQMEALSSYFVEITQLYRVVNKGGVLIGDSDEHFRIRLEGDKQDLLRLYDSRHSNWTDIAAYVGTCVDSVEYEFQKYRELLSKSKNVLFVTPRSVIESGSLGNFIPSSVDASDLARFLELFSEEFYSENGVSLNSVLVFLNALSSRELLCCVDDEKWFYNLLQRGYVLTRPKEFVDSILEYDESLDRSEVELVFSFFTSKTTGINLWTRGPISIFTRVSESNYVIDYSCVVDALSSATRFIGRLEDESGNKKARHFERKVWDRVGEVFGEKARWHKGELINSRTKERIEVDASFVVEDILFIVECKSVNVSVAFDKGDREAVDFRIGKCREALREVHNKVDFLLKNKSELNHAIPNTRYIVPLVVTPFPEYVWHNSSWLFLSKDLPRILSMDELGRVLALKMESVISQKYCSLVGL